VQFGILYSYWSREWACDLEGYAKIIKKVSDLGFDILEISAHHVYEMSQDELRKLNALAQERGITFTTNSGPAEQYDLASADPGQGVGGRHLFPLALQLQGNGQAGRLGAEHLLPAGDRSHR
jgi:D-psicose/D-tagatose/L-ribulose 3-epimerase